MRRVLILSNVIIFLGFIGLAQPLEVWQRLHFAEGFNDAIRALVLEWAERTGNKVNITSMPLTMMDEKMLNAIETGILPDLVLFPGGPARVSTMSRGLFVPVDDVIQRLDWNDIYPAVFELERYDTAVYCVPIALQVNYWHIRVDLLEKAGIQIPENPTIEWLIEAAYAVNNPPEVYGLGLPLSACYDAHNTFLSLLYAYGGGTISEIAPNGADIFNSEPTWRLFRDYKKWWNDGLIPPDALGWADIDNNKAFMEGRIFATLNPPTLLYAMIQGNHPLTPYVALVPIPPVAVYQEGVWIYKTTPERVSLAKDLAYYIAAQKELTRVKLCDEAAMFGLPVWISQGEVVSEKIARKEGVYAYALGNVLEMLKAGQIFSPDITPLPYGKPHSAWAAICGSLDIGRALSRLIMENMEPQVLAKELATSWNIELAKWLK